MGRRKSKEERKQEELEAWQPKTNLGRMVKDGDFTDIDKAIDNYRILEPQITDILIKPDDELLKIGQAKGKYGGGRRRVFRQTQRKTAEDNVPTFSCMAVIGDKNGHVGMGMGFAKETFPARDKAIRKAKLEVMNVNRGCGSFDCSCDEPHSIPLEVRGKCGSSEVVLMPAPQGTGLVIGDELKKILKLAGIKDVYSKTFGQTRTTINLAKACIEALNKTNIVREE